MTIFDLTTMRWTELVYKLPIPFTEFGGVKDGVLTLFFLQRRRSLDILVDELKLNIWPSYSKNVHVKRMPIK